MDGISRDSVSMSLMQALGDAEGQEAYVCSVHGVAKN